MGVEIERKFLVTSSDWRAAATPGKDFRQGYLVRGKVQVRIRRVGDKGYITVKGPRRGISRAEFEYEIPVQDAEEMLGSLCKHPLIEKTRHEVQHGAHLWEIDVYTGANEGLIVAEVELDESDETFVAPPWIGADVTGDARYSNAALRGKKQHRPKT